LPGTNILAYLASSSATKEKSFKSLTPDQGAAAEAAAVRQEKL
jgi:hypothetical protein